jgi:hypothetical protein
MHFSQNDKHATGMLLTTSELQHLLFQSTGINRSLEDSIESPPGASSLKLAQPMDQRMKLSPDSS